MSRALIVGQVAADGALVIGTAHCDDGWIKGVLDLLQRYDYHDGAPPKMRDDAAPPDMIGLSGIRKITELAAGTPDGCFVEVGVYRGGSAWHLAKIARLQRRALHLFDTFTGIPFKGDGDTIEVGHFADTSEAAVKKAIPDAIIHAGLFPQTLPPSLTNIAFAHIDCDQYDSVKSCIENLWPLMVSGGIMYFDDYHWLEGATRAVDESFAGKLFPGDANRVYVVKA